MKNADIDAALDTVKTSVDFDVIKQAMADFQTVYVDQTLEIPLYYRKNVELVGPDPRELLREPDPGRPDMERRRLVQAVVRVR